ncbi:hypothetical protein ACVGWU_11235, partial [Enterobacter intestinihominis]
LRPVQRRIGAGNDFRPDWLDGWCETKSVCAVLKKRRVAATPYPAYGIEQKSWFCRPGKRSASRRNLQRPPIPPGLLRPVQRRIGAPNEIPPDRLDGWCETKSVCAVLKKRREAATPYPAYGSKENLAFV